MPAVGGQYAYLKAAYHPIFGFLYGWVLLLVVQTGGMAAVTVTFARYFVELVHTQWEPRLVGTVALNSHIGQLFARKLGSRVQSALTVWKIICIVCGGRGSFPVARFPLKASINTGPAFIGRID